MLRSGLESLGSVVKVTDIPSGEEAILVSSRQHFDLLVADVRLAGMSGLELMQKARQRNSDLKVILITGLTDPEVRRLVAGAGALYLAAWFGTSMEAYHYAAWQGSYLCMAAVMLAGVLTTLLIPEPEVNKRLTDYPAAY